MECPKCYEKFICKEDFLEHVQAHSIDPWRVKQLLAEWDLYFIKEDVHSPYKPCKCRAYGNKFECELRVHKAL